MSACIYRVETQSESLFITQHDHDIVWQIDCNCTALIITLLYHQILHASLFPCNYCARFRTYIIIMHIHTYAIIQKSSVWKILYPVEIQTLFLSHLQSLVQREFQVIEWVLLSLTLVPQILNCEEKAKGLA